MASTFTMNSSFVDRLKTKIAYAMEAVGEEVAETIRGKAPVGSEKHTGKRRRPVAQEVKLVKSRSSSYEVREGSPKAGQRVAGFRFEPASTRKLSASMSRSIRAGTFFEKGNYRILGGKMYATFHTPGRIEKVHLRDTIVSEPQLSEGSKAVVLITAHAPYALYVEKGHRVGKSSKKVAPQPFMVPGLEAHRQEITDGSILRRALEG